MAARKNSGQIKEDILNYLKEGPISTKKLSEIMKSNWSTINFYLKELAEEKKVRKIISSNNINYYIRSDDPVYYGLPFSKKIRNETIYLLSKVLELWKDKHKVYPNKTTTQKIAVEVIKDCNLDLPVLDFHYGKVTCMSITPNNKIEQTYGILPPKNADTIKRCIRKVINDPEHNGRSFKERELQYDRQNMGFYKAKDKVIELFDEKDNNEKIIDALNLLSLNFPIKLQEFYFEFNNFISTSVALLSVNTEEDNIRKFKETFYSLWDILTTLSFFKDAEKYIELRKRDLLAQMRDSSINFKKMSYENLFSEFESELINIDPEKLKMPEGEESLQIQRLIREALEEE